MGGLVTLAVAFFTEHTVIAYAVSMIASMVISKALAPNLPNAQTQPNPGSKQQIPPATDNRLPVVYGSAYVGGTVTDVAITANNQVMYWVLALSEITNTDSTSTGGADVYSFGNVYYGGKLCVFDPIDKSKVTGLRDVSTGDLDVTVLGQLYIYLYRNGSNGATSGFNTTSNAWDIISATNSGTPMSYTWNSTKTMTNTCFAIVKVIYNATKGYTALAQTKFQIINPRNLPGDCFVDYMVSKKYGGAILPSAINMTTMNELNQYSSSYISYIAYDGTTTSQQRYQFNGSLDTNIKIMSNLQSMADCCNCLIKYNEIMGQWGVIVQQPNNQIVMNLNDSNIVSAITVAPLDISNSFNVVEVSFPDKNQQDVFATASYDLAVLRPDLLFPNEPINKQTLNLYLVNNSVQAQYLANIYLEAAREDLQVMFDIDYTGLQLDSGDIVTVTNSNYGWNAKQFRIVKVVQKFSDTAQIATGLTLSEFNSAVYDDKNVTQFTPADDSGLPSPSIWGAIFPPVITVSNTSSSATTPYFTATITTPNVGIVQYAELWYSLYLNPTTAQRIFYGTTEINAEGNPYPNGQDMPSIIVTGISAGNYYFFTRMVNSLNQSAFSSASTILNWRPTTFQYNERYNNIAYANDSTGSTGFSLTRSNQSYFGINNSSSSTAPSTASSYTWYSVNDVSNGRFTNLSLSPNVAVIYANRGNRQVSVNIDYVTAVAGNRYVPTTTTDFDSKIWQGLVT